LNPPPSSLGLAHCWWGKGFASGQKVLRMVATLRLLLSPPSNPHQLRNNLGPIRPSCVSDVVYTSSLATLYVDSDFSAVFFDFGISRDAISLIRFKKKSTGLVESIPSLYPFNSSPL
jgi:hypothetical protein